MKAWVMPVAWFALGMSSLLCLAWKLGDAHGYRVGYEEGSSRDVFTVNKTESVRCWCQVIGPPKRAAWDMGGPPNLLWQPSGRRPQ
jgi:hypothetical protein